LAAKGGVSATLTRSIATNGKRSSGLRTLDARFGDNQIVRCRVFLAERCHVPVVVTPAAKVAGPPR